MTLADLLTANAPASSRTFYIDNTSEIPVDVKKLNKHRKHVKNVFKNAEKEIVHKRDYKP